MKNNAKSICRIVSRAATIALLASAMACAVAGPVSDQLNPYGGDATGPGLGSRDTNALGGGGGANKEAEAARHALEVMGTYRKQQSPQPVYPIVQPAEVRLMWVPDHLNKHGDLVPAHYYYLRVLNDRWEVQDAFELDQQLKTNSGINYNGGSAPTSSSGAAPGGSAQDNYGTGSSGSSTPWVYKETK